MPTITVTIDDTHEGYALYGELICRYGVDATDFDLNGGYTLEDYNADLDAISGVSDLMRGRTPDLGDAYPSTHTERDDDTETDPTPPHGTPRPYLTKLDIIRTVACPEPGCPGTLGEWCGSPITKNSYGPHFIHKARKVIHKARKAAAK